MTKEKLPEVLFKTESLSSDEQLHMTMYMTHCLLMYIEEKAESAIELPPGISHSSRVIIHHIADRLGLGSITKGNKGTNK